MQYRSRAIYISYLLLDFCLGIALMLINLPLRAEIPKQLAICDIGGEYPPFSYYKRENGQPSGEVTGFAVDYVRAILRAHDISATVDLIPWKRCQAEVVTGRYAMLLSAANNPERERVYLISKTYYAVHEIYFYAKDKPFPKLENVDNMRRLKICGQSGFTYLRYGLRDEEIETMAKNFPQAMEMLKAHRCDIVLGRLEVAAGYQYTNGIDYTQSADFGWAMLKGMEPTAFHIMVSRNLPYSAELLDLINRGIDQAGTCRTTTAIRRDTMSN